MSTLILAGLRDSQRLVPSDTLENVRSTVTTVNPDADASVATSTPERGRLETDPATEGGLTTHQVASQVDPVERTVSATAVTAHSQHQDSLNASWSNAGTAAAREAAGEWGHGTVYSQDAIERIPDGTAFNETYFARERRGPNEEVTNYMSAANPVSNKELTNTSEVGIEQARTAPKIDPYQAMYNARMGIPND